MLEDLTEISESEKRLSSNIRNDRLIGEIALSQDDIVKLSALINKIISSDIRQGIQLLETKFPTCTACFLVWKGILDYIGGDYWSSIRNSIGISDPNVQNKLGDIFIGFLNLNKLPSFMIEDSLTYVTPILMHGMIPNSYLYEYFEKILIPLSDDLTNPDDINSWLQNRRKDNADLIKIKLEIDEQIAQKNMIESKLSQTESLINIWDELQKIRDLEVQAGDPSEFDSVPEGLSKDRNRIQSEIQNIQNKIEIIEDKISLLHKGTGIFSKYDQIILINSDAINQCSNILPDLENGLKNLVELKYHECKLEKNLEGKTKSKFYIPYSKKHDNIILEIPFDKLDEKVKTINSKKKDESYVKEGDYFKNIVNIIHNWVDYILLFGKYKEKEDKQVLYNEIDDILKCLPLNKNLLQEPDELIKDLKSIKDIIDQLYLIRNRINSQIEKNDELINVIKNLSKVLEINFSDDILQTVTYMQDILLTAKNHKQLAFEIEEEIKDIEKNYRDLSEQKQKQIDDLQKIDAKLAILENGDIQSGIEILERRRTAWNEAKSRKNDLVMKELNLGDLQREINASQINGKDKNYYNLELDSLKRNVESIEKKIKELRKIKKQIPVPFYYVDKPVRRFLLYGVAEEFVNQSVQMVVLKKKGISGYSGINLPERIISKFDSWWNSLLFCESDLIDSSGLMVKLRDAKEPISDYILKKFSNEMQQIIKGYDASNPLSEHVQRTLIEELNKIIQGSNIYDEQIFSLLELTDETLELIEKNPQGTELIRLNRMLLEEAYFNDLAENEESAQKSKFRCPVIFFNEEERKIMVSFHSQRIKIPGESPEDAQMHLVMNSSTANLHDTKLDIDIFNENLYNTDDEINFDISEPSESYEFHLKNENEILKQWEFTGLCDDHPFLAFDYDSGKLISEDILPEGRVLLISNHKFKFESENVDFIYEPGNLFKNWKEYIYRPVNLSNTSKLFLVNENIKIEIKIGQTPDYQKPFLDGGRVLDDVDSNGKKIYVGKPPSIKIPVKTIEEKRRWDIFIIPGSDSTFTKSFHRLIDLDGILFDNGMMEIPLSNENLMGNSPLGEVTFHLRRGSSDYPFNFLILSRLDYEFSKEIYLPGKDIAKVSLRIIDLKKEYFNPNSPAKITHPMYANIETVSSQENIYGILEYPLHEGNFISMPISFHIPRLTWHIEGLKDNKYSMDSNKIIDISEDDWNNRTYCDFSLLVNLHYNVTGDCKLILRPDNQQSLREIKDGKVKFDLSRFNGTIKENLESILFFELTIIPKSKYSLKIKNAQLFNILKWQIKNIECEQKIDGDNKRVLEIKWKEEGSIKNKIIHLWKLQVEPRKVYSKHISYNYGHPISIKIKKNISGNFLIHFTKQDDANIDIFPGENSPFSKKIFIEKRGAWDFLAKVENNLKIYRYVIRRLQIGEYDITELIDITEKIERMKKLYDYPKKRESTTSRNALSDFNKLKTEFENNVKKLLSENDNNNTKIREILKMPNIETNN